MSAIERHFLMREKCPACESDNTKTVLSRNFSDSALQAYLQEQYAELGKMEFEYLQDTRFEVDECQFCGLFFQKSIPDEFLMKKLYQEWIGSSASFDLFRKRAKLAKRRRCAGEIMMIIAFLGKPSKDLKFMDFGMGWGGWCVMAKAFGCDAYGVEFSESRAEYARSNGIELVKWETLPDAAFDFINTEQVMEHVPQPLDTLRYLVQSLKPNGLIKISVPNGSDLKRRLKIQDWSAPRRGKNSMYLISPLEHINCYLPKSLITMARKAGLKQVKIPIAIQLRYTINLTNTMEAAKSVLRPFYRNLLGKGTYLFFRKSSGSVHNFDQDRSPGITFGGTD